MTAGERLIQKGVQQGIQQGERTMLLRLLRQRYGNQVDADTERRLELASAAHVATWAEHMFTAATLNELLAD